MKTILTLIAALFLSSGLALAADAKKADAAAAKTLTSSQQRMVDCNKEATGKKGQERRDFMRQCLHGGGKPDAAAAGPAPAAPVADAKMSQKDKMKECNKQAGEKALKGPERKAFMKDCLKGK